MNNVTTFRIELEISAQKIVHQFMANNEHVEEQLQSAIKKAVESFDFEKEVVEIATHQLRKAIREALDYRFLEEKVKELAGKIYEQMLEKEFSKYKS